MGVATSTPGVPDGWTCTSPTIGNCIVKGPADQSVGLDLSAIVDVPNGQSLRLLKMAHGDPSKALIGPFSPDPATALKNLIEAINRISHSTGGPTTTVDEIVAQKPIPGAPLGKTAIIEAITPLLLEMGVKILIITNDVVTTEDAKHVQRTLKGILIEERILGVETGACPHTAVREDPSMNLAAVEDMEARFPETDLVIIESGGDNLTLTFSPALVDFFIYVIDVAAGDKIPRKNGPGISQADILVINKTDLAPYVGASLAVMDADSRVMRGDKPFVFTNCMTGEGIDELVQLIRENVLFDLKLEAVKA